MNSPNKVVEYGNSINSKLPEGQKIDFNDSYHGPLGILWNISFNYEGIGDVNPSHIGFLKSFRLIEEDLSSTRKYTANKSGKEMAIFYMAALENKLKQLDPTVERLYEIDVMSFKHE
ncbi:MAG: hypothetical protein HY833_00105 [Candidatus Aenigmarchaeota archaeon]|nr:hypothetical protein [Candidatus Aenigmarchaeota archaeon]